MHRFIAAEKVNHSVATLCRVLEVSRSGYYAAQRRPACRRVVEDRRLGELIADEHKRSRKTYGAPRIHTQLTRAGERVGKKRVARLMRQSQLSGLVPRRKGKTTIRVPGIETSPDLVRREWNPTEPNRLWVADITYVRTWEGWIYLGCGRRLLQPQGRRLVDRRQPAGRARRRRGRDGDRAPPAARPGSFTTPITGRNTSAWRWAIT